MLLYGCGINGRIEMQILLNLESIKQVKQLRNAFQLLSEMAHDGASSDGEELYLDLRNQVDAAMPENERFGASSHGKYNQKD